MNIIYALATNEDYYTNQSEDEPYVPALIDRIEKEIVAYMDDQYPEVDFEVRRVPETTSQNNKTRYYVSPKDGYAEEWEAQLEAELEAQGVVRELDLLISEEFPYWFEEVCAGAGFVA